MAHFPAELWRRAFKSIVKAFWKVADVLAKREGRSERDVYRELWHRVYPEIKQYIYEKLAAGIVPSVDEIANLIASKVGVALYA